jgi:hypothetical protein
MPFVFSQQFTSVGVVVEKWTVNMSRDESGTRPRERAMAKIVSEDLVYEILKQVPAQCRIAAR